jgi:Mrp family chromosome partitioning ATPase
MQNNIIFEIAYKNTASNISIQCQKKDARVLTFTTTSTQKYKTAILYRLACELNKLGKSVLVIDADLNAPTLHKDADITDKVWVNLSDLIQNIEGKLKTNQILTARMVFDAIVEDNNGISLLVNTKPINDSYQYFGTSAFYTVISTLKERYDFILIDTRSALIAPEFPIISRVSDGIILFTNMGIGYSNLRQVASIIESTDIPLLGSIVRESDSNLEKDYLEYTRSLGTNASSIKESDIVRN